MARNRTRKAKRRQGDEASTVSSFMAQHGDYRPALVVDLTGELGGRRQSMVRVLLNRKNSTVDRWLFEGGPGFEEPQRRAIDHCRSLWRILGSAPVVANYNGLTAGEGDREGYLTALAQLGGYEDRIGMPHIWRVFEDVVRHDLPAGRAGGHIAEPTHRDRARAKACVGFVASKIAEWRGY